MIIWKGYGFAIVLFALFGLVAGASVADAIQTEQSWPFVAGLLLAAAANYFTAKKLESDSKRLIDPESGQEVILKRGDSLFFVPMKYWTYVIVALASLGLIFPGPG